MLLPYLWIQPFNGGPQISDTDKEYTLLDKGCPSRDFLKTMPLDFSPLFCYFSNNLEANNSSSNLFQEKFPWNTWTFFVLAPPIPRPCHIPMMSCIISLPLDHISFCFVLFLT